VSLTRMMPTTTGPPPQPDYYLIHHDWPLLLLISHPTTMHQRSTYQVRKPSTPPPRKDIFLLPQNANINYRYSRILFASFLPFCVYLIILASIFPLSFKFPSFSFTFSPFFLQLFFSYFSQMTFPMLYTH
jgi:hypothetical protein